MKNFLIAYQKILTSIIKYFFCLGEEFFYRFLYFFNLFRKNVLQLHKKSAILLIVDEKNCKIFTLY